MKRARKRALQRGGVARKLSCKISKKQLAAFNIDLCNKVPSPAYLDILLIYC